MPTNDLLLAHLAAQSADDVIAEAMAGSVFGLTGEIGPEGFGATTLEGHLVLFTHPEFYRVAGLPKGLDAVEATARQAADYALAIGLAGFVLNPGTHQRFIPASLWRDDAAPPAPPAVPVLSPPREAPKALVDAVVAAAEGSNVEAVWLADGPAVATKPHPDPAFEAGLLARDVRLKSYAAALWWPPAFAQAAARSARIRLRALAVPLDPAFAADLSAHAKIHRLDELWAFEAAVEDAEPTLALAFSPHPNDAFARDFDVLHARHGLGGLTVPLLDAAALHPALPQMAIRLP